MGANRRRPNSMLLLAALLLFGTLNAASGDAAGWAGPSGRPAALVAAANAAALTAPAALDTRLLAEARAERAPGASRHDGLSAAGPRGPGSGRAERRVAAAVERAAHPERRSGTRLRGPPGLPV
ncbi:MAG TPA: hypothetical protein VKX24_10050 [Acidimicrobiia bacterium]|nr:hypothetical protein [Acidimicrobiia bacterium]HZQ77063.1 hypothetical protein [Acidimicrobiia bacterium]